MNFIVIFNFEMGKVERQAIKVMKSNQEFIPPFYIIKDHRKSLRLRLKRELRKMKILKEKQFQKEIV